ncbi:MAG: peptidoglycan-binding domain-containing protein [Candidatus Pacebacteria bacterium]|nr:peptidoglycan-binding domain-containing protein [Candidatus Paceibacterota bacterium]
MKRHEWGALGCMLIASVPVVAQASSTSSCPQLVHPLSLGASDQTTEGEVSKLQQFLSSMSTDTPVMITGYFGQKTATALERFQAENGVVSTGTMTASTSAAIVATCLIDVTASFDTPAFLSLSAAPTFSGTAVNLATPLSLSIRDTLGEVVFQDDHVPTLEGRWSVTAPTLSVGTYQTLLSTEGVVLATGTAAIGIPSLPRMLPDTASLPVSDVADGRLMRFGIYAGSQNDISIAQISFAIATTSVDVSNVNLYAYMDPAYTIAATTSALGNLVNDAPLDASSGTLRIVPDTPIVIPKGKAYFFELDGTVVPSDTRYAVTTTLLGDSFANDAQTFTDLAGAGAHLIWSPNTFGSSATSDADWVSGASFSGFGTNVHMTRTNVPLLPLPPIVQSIQSTDSSSLGSTSISIPDTLAAASTSNATTTVVASASSTLIDYFNVVPQAGPAPLQVHVTGAVNTVKSCTPAIFVLQFGDNGSYKISLPSKYCKPIQFSTTHTYQRVGTYKASLVMTYATSSKVLQTQTIVATSTKLSFINPDFAAAVLAVPEAFIQFFLRLTTAW